MPPSLPRELSANPTRDPGRLFVPRYLRRTQSVEELLPSLNLRGVATTAKTRNCLSRSGILPMIFKLCQAAERNWRRLQGYKLLADVIRNVRFVDGIREDRIAA